MDWLEKNCVICKKIKKKKKGKWNTSFYEVHTLDHNLISKLNNKIWIRVYKMLIYSYF